MSLRSYDQFDLINQQQNQESGKRNELSSQQKILKNSNSKPTNQSNKIIVISIICILLGAGLLVSSLRFYHQEQVVRQQKKQKLNNKFASIEKQIDQRIRKLKIIQDRLKQTPSKIRYIEKELDQRDKNINSLEEIYNQKIKKLISQAKSSQDRINQLFKQQKDKQAKIAEFQKLINQKKDIEKQLKENDNKIVQLQKQLKQKEGQLEKQLQEKNMKINQFKKQLKEKDNKIAESQKNIKEKDSKFIQLQKQIKDKESKIGQLQKLVKEKSEKINQYEKSLEQKTQTIKKLSQSTQITNKQVEKASQTIKNPNPNFIDILYNSKNYQPLPINPLRKDSNNKTIADVLYKDDETRKKRLQFIRQRNDFVNKYSDIEGSAMIKYNLIADPQIMKVSVTENEKEWLRLQKKQKLTSVKQELPMCIISSSYNNNAFFRIQANLNSIFLQNYTNFKHVIINDVSTDGSNQVYRNYFNFYSIDKNRYAYIENSKRKTALENIYEASMQQCSNDSIVVIVDGDDEIVGRNTLKLFNWAFQTKKAGVIYSNFYSYSQLDHIRLGWTIQYTEEQKKNNLFRTVKSKFSHLRAGRAQLFRQIKLKDLQDQKGEFFKATADVALFLPLMELSCGRVFKIQGEYNLLYNSATGLNEFTVNFSRQKAVYDKIHNYPRYQCSKPFNQRMSK